MCHRHAVHHSLSVWFYLSGAIAIRSTYLIHKYFANVRCFINSEWLFQVHVQTELKGRPKAIQLTLNLLRSDGLLGFYSGLTATLLRQVIINKKIRAAQRGTGAPKGYE